VCDIQEPHFHLQESWLVFLLWGLNSEQ